MVRICLILLLTAIAEVKAQSVLYHLRFSTSVKTQFSMIGADIPDTVLTGTLEGVLRMTMINKGKHNTVFSCSFDTLSKVSFPLTDKQQQQMKNDLKKGFAFRQSKNGGMDSIYFHPDISEETESVIVQLLECYQSNIPEKRTSVWKSTITLSDGTADAFWSNSTALDKKKNSVVHLTKLREHSNSDPAAVEMIYRYTDYETDLCWIFGTDNSLLQLEGHLNRKAKVNHKTMTMLDNSISLSRLASGIKKDKGQFRTPNIKSYTYVRILNYTKKTKEREQRDLQDRSKRININTLLQGIAANQIKKDENLRDMLVENIRLSFLVEKDSLWLFKNALMNTLPDSLDFRTLRAGIASSSTSYAQEIIAEYLNRFGQDDMRLRRMIPSAGLMKNTGHVLQFALEKIAFGNTQNASAAKLALGNIVGSIRKNNPKRADSITSRLAISLVKDSDDYLMLSVMGNCGTDAILPYVQPYLSDSVPALRGYACYTLRFLTGEAIDEIYLRSLKTEVAEDAQQHIFNGLFFREPNQATIDYIFHLITTENNEGIALAALRLLFKYSYNQPELLKLIYESSQKGSTEELRKIANEFYASTDEGALNKK